MKIKQLPEDIPFFLVRKKPYNPRKNVYKYEN